MNRFRTVGVLAVAAAAATLAAGSALAVPKPVPFKASFTGKAVVKTSDASADITATGLGTSTLIGKGKSKLAGKGVGSQADPCPLFGGTASITGPTGLKLNFKIAPATGNACTDEEAQQFSLVGRATIVGGTGKYRLAKGTFKFTGSFNRGTGAFSVKFTGTLKV